MNTEHKKQLLDPELIIPESDALSFEKILLRWNIPEDDAIVILFKLMPPAYWIERKRSNSKYGEHFYCKTIDYYNDLLDYDGEFRTPKYEIIREKIIFRLSDVIKAELNNEGLYCHSIQCKAKSKQQDGNTKSTIERINEFDNCTYDEIDMILNKHPTLSKGKRNCLLAARSYLFGVSPMEAVYYSVIPDVCIKDPASQARRWLRAAKDLLPSLRSKA
ncbi:MAG TPA: hypothetical protein PKC79_03515 [Solidesulfovibrio magneticus]|nr:hypothetical protein [Solidesulfovibrio magneticus]